MKTISVTQYASTLKVSRQAILKKIALEKLPEAHSARKIGNQWVIDVPENFGKTIKDTV